MSIKQVYAIFPLNESGRIAGVYVGSSKDVKERVRNHYYTKSIVGTLMRANGYFYQILCDEPTMNDWHLEYDWMDFFEKRSSFTLLNKKKGLCGADFKRTARKDLGIPVCFDGGVGWQLSTF